MSRSVPDDVHRAVLERDGYACGYCGVRLARREDLVETPPRTSVGGHCGCGLGLSDPTREGLTCVGCCHSRPGLAAPPGVEWPTVDHVVAKARGGTDDLDNLTAACAPCNTRKGTLAVEDWLRL